MELHELFDAALDDLELMPDQVPEVRRIAERRQTRRRTVLGAGAAAFVIGAGTLVAAGPWSASTSLEPGGEATGAAGVLSATRFQQLAALTVINLYPPSDGDQARFIGGVAVHFGTGPVTMRGAVGSPGEGALWADLALARVTDGQAAEDKACPAIPKDLAKQFFCDAYALPDGKVVRISDTVHWIGVSLSPAHPDNVENPQLQQFVTNPELTDPTYGLTPGNDTPGDYLPSTGGAANTVGEISVWEGDAEETLYFSYQVGGASHYLSLAQLKAIADSAGFQNLLDVALASSLVPAPGYTAVNALPSLPVPNCVAVMVTAQPPEGSAGGKSTNLMCQVQPYGSASPAG